MKQTWKKMLGVLLVMALVLPSITSAVSALDLEGAPEISSEAAFKTSNDVWDEIFEVEEKLESEKTADKAIVDKLYEFVENHADVEVVKRESDYHFYFETVGGIPCTYDRRIEMKMQSAQAPAPVNTEALDELQSLLGGKGVTPATNLNIGVYSPYYGFDGNMTLNYLEAAQGVQEVLGEEACSVSSFYGAEGSIESFKRFDEFGVVLVDSHGTASGGKSWICVPAPGAYDTADFTEGNLLNGGSWIGVTGTFFEKYCDDLDNTVVYLGICEGMKTDGLSAPILRHGGGFVMGYTESVTFYYDGLMMPTIHELLVTESPVDPSRYYTVEEACERAKEIHGPVDTYGNAVLIWDGDGDIVLQNEPTPATGVEIVPAVVNDLYVNNTAQLGVTTTPENANNYTLEWSSSNTAVATVDGAGLVTGVAQGTATITVTLRDNLEGGVYTATATVNVPGPLAVTGISLNPTVMGIYTNALPVEIAATIEPENASNKQIVWTTSDPSVATVDSGFVTGVSAGTAVITATTVDGNFAASCEVTVSELESLDDALNVLGGSLSFANDPDYPWTAVVLGSRGVAESTNQGVASSSAVITSVVEMEAGDALRFDWKVSSETNYDKLIFAVNGTAQSNISGKIDWATYSYTAETAGTYTFTWTYSKDNSVNTNDDTAWVDNVELVKGGLPDPTPTPGGGDGNVIFGEYFEENPTDWALVDADGDGHDWYWFTNEGLTTGLMEAYEGMGVMVSASYDNPSFSALTPDNYLISPDIAIPANAAEAYLSWYVAAQDPAWFSEHYSVLVGPAGSTNPADFTDVIHTETLSSASWVNRTADLSDYAGETVRIAFRHHDVTDMFVIKLDNVEVIAEEGTPQPTPEQPTPPPVEEELIFSEYFEENPTDWKLVDNDGDGHNWYWFNNEGLTTGLMDAYEGMGIMASASYDNPTFTALSPDNYLISPDITIPADAAEAYLSWYVAAQDPDYFAEKYTVLIGPAGSSAPSDFTELLFTETLSRADWTNRTVDLSAFAGETVCIAFRHHQVSDMFVIKLDQVEVFAKLGAEPTPVPGDLDEALNVPGGTLVFTNDEVYPWSSVADGNRLAAQSSNQGVNSSNSAITSVVEMEAGDLLRFDWKVSSEPNYDKLIFAVNGTAQNNISGLVDWDTYYYRADTAGTYTFTWTYSKDGSVDRNDDVGWVDNVEYVDASEHIYTLTFAAGANGTLTGETSIEVPLGTTLTADMVPTPVPEDGFTFGSWSPFNPVGYFVEENVDFTANFIDSSSTAMITLNVGTVWQDGSGYQMLLDADANAFETGVIPAEGGLTTGGDAPASVYAEFEFKIPENADGALNTQNMLVDNTSASIFIPAGTYDYCITNPTPGDRVWIANSSNGSMGRADDYVFEAGLHYIFTIGTTVIGTSTYDFVTVTVEGETPMPTPTPEQPTPTPGETDLIFGEYFEENPTDWSLVDADGDGHDWYWFTNEGLTTGLMEAYEGMGVMVSASYDNPSFSALTPDNYLISPDIAIPANAAEAYLSWYVAAQDPAWFSEHYSVLVGPAGSTNPADFTDVIHTETLSSASWVNRTADLSDYAGETVRIAFRHHDVTDMFVIKLDQVEVFAQGGTTEPTPTPEQPTPTPGQSDMIFGEYFEENPTDWALVDADGDGHDWYWFTNEGLTTGLMEAYEGMGVMVSASYDNPSFSALTPDNYLISPDIAIPANAAEAYLSWYVAAQDPAWFSEHYSVLVGPAGSTNPADFTDVIHTETLSSASWVNRTADLTDYAGETVRIAFRHHDVTDMFVIKLDQVEVFAQGGTTEPTPTPEQPTPTPPPAEGTELYGYSLVDLENFVDETGWMKFNAADPQNTMQFLTSGGTKMLAADYVDGTVYAFDENGNFYSVDPDTWEETLIGNCNYEVYDMSYDHATGIMYAQVYSAGANPSAITEKPMKANVNEELKPMAFDAEGRYLATVDLNTGEVTELFRFDYNVNIFPIGLACVGNGEFVSADYMTDMLYRFDTEGNFLPLESLAIETGNFYQSMTYEAATNTVYWAAITYSGQGYLVTANPFTGANGIDGYIGEPNGTELVGLFVKQGGTPPVPTPTPEQPTPTPEQPTPTPGDDDKIFGEYFEENPTDWALVDADGDGHDWYWFTNEGLTTGLMEAYEGMGVMVSASYDNPSFSALTPDNYLISPDIAIPANAAEAYLSWYVAAQDPAWFSEHYSVLVGPAGSTNPADFTDVIHTETLSSASWVNRTADLTDYAGETVRIAFRHHDVTDMFVIKLDQVEVFAQGGTTEPTPTPEQPTPTPEQPTPTPEQPTPTPEQPEQPTPTPEQPAEPTPEPEDPPKAGGVSLVLVGLGAAALGSVGFLARRKRG